MISATKILISAPQGTAPAKRAARPDHARKSDRVAQCNGRLLRSSAPPDWSNLITRCSIPRFDGAMLAKEWKGAGFLHSAANQQIRHGRAARRNSIAGPGHDCLHIRPPRRHRGRADQQAPADCPIYYPADELRSNSAARAYSTITCPSGRTLTCCRISPDR